MRITPIMQVVLVNSTTKLTPNLFRFQVIVVTTVLVIPFIPTVQGLNECVNTLLLGVI